MQQATKVIQHYQLPLQLNYHYYSTTPMAEKQTFASQDIRPEYREAMEVDAPVENVEQVEEQPKEPEPEKIVSRYGCPSQ